MARRHRKGMTRQKGPGGKVKQVTKGVKEAPVQKAADGTPIEDDGVVKSQRPHIIITYLLGFFMSAVVLGPMCVIATWVAKIGPEVFEKGAQWSAFSGLIIALVLSLGAAAAITFFANKQFIDEGI